MKAHQVILKFDDQDEYEICWVLIKGFENQNKRGLTYEDEKNALRKS